MDNKDIRWYQRLNHFKRAFARLQSAVILAKERSLTDLEEQGIIQAFEFTHELAWNTLKDFFEERGEQGVYGSKDATRLAFKKGLIEQGDIWMNMIKSRNLSSHTYNADVAKAIREAVCNEYYAEFLAILNRLESLKKEEFL